MRRVIGELSGDCADGRVTLEAMLREALGRLTRSIKAREDEAEPPAPS